MTPLRSLSQAWARLVSNQRPLACEASAVGKQRPAAERSDESVQQVPRRGQPRVAGVRRSSVRSAFGDHRLDLVGAYLRTLRGGA